MTQTSRTPQDLIALGHHMLDHPDLPKWCSLSPRFYKNGYRDGLEIVLPRSGMIVVSFPNGEA